jgi:hypothetical protein
MILAWPGKYDKRCDIRQMSQGMVWWLGTKNNLGFRLRPERQPAN